MQLAINPTAARSRGPTSCRTRWEPFIGSCKPTADRSAMAVTT